MAAPTTMSGVGLVVPGSVNCPLAPAAMPTSPMPRFHTPDFMAASLPHRAVLGLVLTLSAGACAPQLENWTCDWDSSVARPLANRAALADDGGFLPSSECASTCGPPVSSCMLTTVDGGRPGAICPVCRF